MYLAGVKVGFDYGMLGCPKSRCRSCVYEMRWGWSFWTLKKESPQFFSVYESVFCQRAYGARLSGCPAQMFHGVIFAIW
jgi:hypothetical protein